MGETIAFAWDVGGGVRQPFPSSSDPSAAIGGGEGAGWPTHSDRAMCSGVSGSKNGRRDVRSQLGVPIASRSSGVRTSAMILLRSGFALIPQALTNAP